MRPLVPRGDLSSRNQGSCTVEVGELRKLRQPRRRPLAHCPLAQPWWKRQPSQFVTWQIRRPRAHAERDVVSRGVSLDFHCISNGRCCRFKLLWNSEFRRCQGTHNFTCACPALLNLPSMPEPKRLLSSLDTVTVTYLDLAGTCWGRSPSPASQDHRLRQELA